MNDSIVSQKIAESKAIEEQIKNFMKSGGKIKSEMIKNSKDLKENNNIKYGYYREQK